MRIADSERNWHGSSYSNAHGGQCVEVALGMGTTAFRDSKERGRGVVLVPRAAWVTLVVGVRA
ncbi:DUF397 domain-containing protein [Yinghuangia soli]|uniref:DUF397 domain-containing protein n=1 Tax=Yinghuangia soli TaxID=2908204 RepID=A0AA41TY40_9ACTN|nr:DUF397 domain-containing protein [Yinghuangia soli]MCF2525750.1 DUF397 domain-containing protein [Yinghuangia soli]